MMTKMILAAFFVTAVVIAVAVIYGELAWRSATRKLRWKLEAGLNDAVHADARGRNVGGRKVDTPWFGRFWNYEIRGGILVPLDGQTLGLFELEQ